MEIKYQDKTIVYETKQKTYQKVKQFVLQQIPQLESKNWTFIYFDSEGDQVILGDNDDFESTIDYYNSIQKDLVLIVKQMWWKHKKVHSKSKLVKDLLSKKLTEFNDFKIKSFKLPDSDSDDEFINIDFKPGQRYVDDSAQHAERHYEQNAQAKNNEFLKDKLDKLAEKSDYDQTQKAQIQVGCSGENAQFVVKNKEFLETKSQVINS